MSLTAEQVESRAKLDYQAYKLSETLGITEAQFVASELRTAGLPPHQATATPKTPTDAERSKRLAKNPLTTLYPSEMQVQFSDRDFV